MSEHGTQHGGPAATADHGHGHGHAPFPFTKDEKREFEADDIAAGRAVVVLMSAIFCIGLVLYTVVAWVVGG